MATIRMFFVGGHTTLIRLTHQAKRELVLIILVLSLRYHQVL
jgi:hypothetical protein